MKETYKGHKAQVLVAQMRETGWPQARKHLEYWPDDPKAGPRGYTWVIEAKPGLYMRTDGYVR